MLQRTLIVTALAMVATLPALPASAQVTRVPPSSLGTPSGPVTAPSGLYGPSPSDTDASTGSTIVGPAPAIATQRPFASPLSFRNCTEGRTIC